MIIQPIEDTSVVAKDVALAVNHELMIKDVPAEIVPTVNIPRAAAPVAPTPCLVSMMIEFAVTAVVLMVAVPPTSVTVPNELAPAVVVDATDVDMILLPAVPRTKLPLVAVIFPNVAVMVVPAVTVVAALNDPRVDVMLPVEATMLPVVAVIPVPAVNVVKAATDVVAVKAPACVRVRALLVPIAVLLEITNKSEAELSNPIVIVDAPTPLIWKLKYGSPEEAPPVAISTPALDEPEVLLLFVTSTVTSPPRRLWLLMMSPPETRIPPVVTVKAFPTVIAPVEATVVPVTAAGVKEPRAGGDAKLTLKVSVPAVPAVDSIPVPAKIAMFPETGVIAPPLEPVKLMISPEELVPNEIQLPEPGHIKEAADVVLSHKVPFTYFLSADVGFLVANCKSGGRIALTPIYCLVDLARDIPISLN